MAEQRRAETVKSSVDLDAEEELKDVTVINSNEQERNVQSFQQFQSLLSLSSSQQLSTY